MIYFKACVRGDCGSPACGVCNGPLTVADADQISGRASAFVVLPEGVGAPDALPRDIVAIRMDGWNGSYHDPHFFPTSGRVVLAAIGHRAGRLGRLRKAARTALAQSRPTKSARHEKTGAIIAYRKGVWRDGD